MEVKNRVLLVEDEAPLRRSLENFLERAGYGFDSCASAREALVLAAETPYHVVVVEYHLPDANGIDLLKKLKRNSPDTVAVVISEFDFQSVAEKLVETKVQSFLQKPFDLVNLESALCSACSKDGVVREDVDRKRGLRLKAVPVPPFFRVLSEA
ncbi:MAG: response regulator [Syntrophobacteraceae bacterium]